ncbi:MAG: glycosyltransferase family 2 protein, partial [Bacteroidales bacterium]|nr:glycosyltransferase family 2 protein [Bacteroidales bacterium]
LTPAFLKAIDFHELDPEKNWYDVFISHQSCALGFDNFLMCDNAVLHKPHGSRPWKQLKYTHPLKYYWLKFTKGLDKI